MHLRDTDNWLSNTTRPIGANHGPTNTWSRTSADAITSQVSGRYRHVGEILSLEWTSGCLGLGIQNRILEVWRTPLILNFGMRRRFQDVIYAVRRLNGSPAQSYGPPVLSKLITFTNTILWSSSFKQAHNIHKHPNPNSSHKKKVFKIMILVKSILSVWLNLRLWQPFWQPSWYFEHSVGVQAILPSSFLLLKPIAWQKTPMYGIYIECNVNVAKL